MPKYSIIELSENEAKWLLVSKVRKKDPVIEAIASVDLSDLDREAEGLVKRGQRIRDLLKQHKALSLPCGLIIPKQNSIVRTVVLPSTDPEELAGMAQFEAEKFIPFNVERHIISNCTLHSDDVQGSTVLLTAVDRPVMESALSVLKEAGLSPEFAEVSSVSLMRALGTYRDVMTHGSSLVLLNVTRHQSELCIVQNGMLIASRSQSLGIAKLLQDLGTAMHLETAPSIDQLQALDFVNPDSFLIDGGHITEGEQADGTTTVGDACRNWFQRVVRFIKQTLDFAAREHQTSQPSTIHLSGEAAAFRGLSQMLASTMNVEVLEFHPLGEVARSAQVDADPVLAKGMVTCVGAALRIAEEGEDPKARVGRVNLLPAEVIERQEAAERKVLLMISAAMVLITGVLLFLAYDTQAKHSDELRQRYARYIREMRPTIEELEKKSEQLDIIRQITTNHAGSMYILDQISQFAGMGSTKEGGVLTLTEFRYTVRGEVTIGGMAVNFEDMQRFADFLERLTIDGRAVFESVGLPQPTPIDMGQRRGTVYSFSITAVLNDLAASPARDGN